MNTGDWMSWIWSLVGMLGWLNDFGWPIFEMNTSDWIMSANFIHYAKEASLDLKKHYYKQDNHLD